MREKREVNLNETNRSASFNYKEVIQINGLKVWTPEEKSLWRRKVTKPKMMILNNITGCIKDGEFVALIGPSGAGKTTFLVSLAGKCSLPSDGDVTIGGRNVRELQGVVEMVPQVEVFMDSLTVMEHLVFMTEMKLGSYKKHANRTKLNTLVSELKLNTLAHALISSLSGGERKLLSLASSLLSSPQILICDEPTTGLDSYNATLVVGVLKKIAMSGKVVVCSIHQPSSDLFKEFSSIALMADGRLLFHGSREECKDMFESMNLICPKNYNPAEFYIKAVSNQSANENYAERIMENHQDRSHECDPTGSEDTPIRLFNISQRNWLKQVQLLLWRSSLTLTRDIRDHLIQLFVFMMITSIVIGACYVGISGTTQRGVQDLRGFLWLICSEVSFSLTYYSLYVFESELTLFRREVGMYSGSAYYVARFLCIVPRCIIWSALFIAVATLAVELPNHIITALEFTVALMGTAVAATAYGLGMGALFTSSGVMADVMPCADLPLFLMCGAFLRISTLPLWLYPLKYVSHFYYGMDAVSNIYWRQIGNIECTSDTTTCVKDGVSVLIENGYSDDFILEDCIGLTFVTIIWSLLGYYGLRREEKKGYAY